MASGIALVAFEDGHNMPGTDAYQNHLTELQKFLRERDGWPVYTSARPALEINWLYGRKGQQTDEKFNVLIEVTAKDEADLRQVFERLEAFCHVEGYQG